jgi:hypothetical protein
MAKQPPRIPGLERPIVTCERCGLRRKSASVVRASIPQHRCHHGALCVGLEAMACERCEVERAYAR